MLLDALDSNWIAPLGPHVDAFEREFSQSVGSDYAVAVSSGTAAIHLALLAAGVQPGDRVITPTLTFAATANAVLHAGATPVFIDADAETWTIDPVVVERVAAELAAAGRPARAVLPVDLFGHCADYDTLRDTCSRHGMRLVADAAESLGAHYRGRSAGVVAEVGCFSFNGNKIITTSGGGMVVTNRRDWADRVRHLASQARCPGPQYEHDEVGHNYRLSNLLAAVGRAQLTRLGDRVARRRAINEEYHERLADLPGVSFLADAPYERSSHWLTCLQLDPATARATAEDIRTALEAENIESRPVWKPLHLQRPFAWPVATRDSGPPIAERLWRRGLCLPSGSSLSTADVDRVSAIVRATLSRAPTRHAA